MFNIGPFELMVILLLALVVVGPSRLPEVGRSIGKGLRELRKVQDEVRDSINFDLDAEPAPRARTPKPRTPRTASSTAAPATPATPIEPEAPAAGTSPGAAIGEPSEAEPSDPSPPEPSSPDVAPAGPPPGSPNGSTPTPEHPAE
jgi:Tat protein translocase TatB subunit